MTPWEDKSSAEQMEILEELVSKIAEQMAAAVDAGDSADILDSIIISNGNLREQVGMFRIGQPDIGMLEVGIVAQRSGITCNIAIGIRTATLEDGQLVLAVRGLIVGGPSAGYYYLLARSEEGMLQRVGAHAIRMSDWQDVGHIERDMLSPFLQSLASNHQRGAGSMPDRSQEGRAHGNGPARISHTDIRKTGRFWIEVRK